MVWRWEGKAFGESPPTGSITVNLRFPGQYYDAETGFHYNWNRYYDPRIGRYITSDPIGIVPGIGLPPWLPKELKKKYSASSIQERLISYGPNQPYAYVDNNPLRWIDLTGLDRYDICKDFGAVLNPICKGCVDTACSFAPRYYCEVDKTSCLANSDGDSSKMAECMAEWMKCQVKAKPRDKFPPDDKPKPPYDGI